MQTLDMMKSEKSNKKIGALSLFFTLVTALLGGSVELSRGAETSFPSGVLRSIVIDPGHGGYDTGARGPGGSLEKEITLAAARALAKELKPDYDVVLTRNGDYQVTLTKRSSIANHHRADLFISLHTGGGALYQMDDWSVFYYKNTDHPEKKIASDKDDALPVKWDDLSRGYQKESSILAGCLKGQLAENREIRAVNIAGAALRVLEGVNMPSILIETGYLTNPKTEKLLNDTPFLTHIAKQIKKGVDIYLTR